MLPSMSPNFRLFLSGAGIIGILILALFLIPKIPSDILEPTTQTASNASVTGIAPEDTLIIAPAEFPASSTPKNAEVAADEATTSEQAKSLPATTKKEPEPEPKEDVKVQGDSDVMRVQNPYSSPPLPFSRVNEEARAALVNILCGARNGSLRPVSGSGVIIDPRGVILTNSHVAQYVLLASDPQVDLSCVIRSGSPARPHWSAEVLYIPTIWVKEHANDINTTRPLGTGEHDYALLRINGALINSQLPHSFPYLSPDTRDAIGFVDDQVLVASYPAEFIGGITTQLDLYPASSITTIKSLLTFANKTVDLLSIGGVIEAQSGSSGGALVNEWGRLIGIISTTSEGTTTAQRDLRAITLSYINRDILAQNGSDLPTILEGDVIAQAHDFNETEAPELIRILIEHISGRSR